MAQLYPSYLNLLQSGELARRAEIAWNMLSSCTICPQNCKVNRLAGKKAVCRSADELIVGSWNVHRREEPPISGSRGAGTIFFGHCQARCTYCQNFWLSQNGQGNVITHEKLAQIMLLLQKRQVHNIDLVTPTHYVPHILKALVIAAENGLRLPLVYNCAGYENMETLQLLDGVVDIYLPDAKYADDKEALRTSKMPNYTAANRQTLREMLRQVGPLQVDENGIGVRGLLIRHLVMPNGIAGTREVLRWIADELGQHTPTSVMDQYFPAWKAHNDPTLNRRLTWKEYSDALDDWEASGLTDGFPQEDLMELDVSNDI